MIDKSKRIGFIGAGNMAEAIFRGLIASEEAEPHQIVITDIRAERCAELQSELGITVQPSASDLVGNSDVVIIAVKPQSFGHLAQEIKGTTKPDQLFISILAGTTLETLERELAHEGCLSPRVVRSMPNTPALIRRGATGLTGGAHATNADVEIALQIFGAVGVAEVVDDLEAITGVTGSGPAYVFRMIEALVEAGVGQGIDREVSERLVKQMVAGAAQMAFESEHSPAELRRRVTSPGGTTAEGLKVMEDQEFPRIMSETVDASVRKARELGK